MSNLKTIPGPRFGQEYTFQITSIYFMYKVGRPMITRRKTRLFLTKKFILNAHSKHYTIRFADFCCRRHKPS